MNPLMFLDGGAGGLKTSSTTTNTSSAASRGESSQYTGDKIVNFNPPSKMPEYFMYAVIGLTVLFILRGKINGIF